MSLRSWQAVTLLAATLTMGLTAGVFGDWTHTIMPGLGTTDDRTFVDAFQALDRAIYNPLFMLPLMGSLGVHRRRRDPPRTRRQPLGAALGRGGVRPPTGERSSSPWRSTSR